MMSTYTGKYTKISSGYMGQLVEWPEVITEGKTLEECRELLQDALREMIIAYRQQKKKSLLGEACWSKYLWRYRMSVKRRDLIKYFEQNGFYMLREGKKHSIYTNNERTIPIKRSSHDR